MRHNRLLPGFALLLGLLISDARAMADTEPVGKLVVFGTSLTARGGWRAPLATRLSSCLKRDVSVSMVARSGATSLWGLEHVNEVVQLRPDVVVIEFYANDAALNRMVTLGRSRETIDGILTELRQRLPRARLIVQVMNPFSGIRGMIRPFVDNYIDAHLAQAKHHGAEIVDHRPVWLAMPASELANAIPDGAHPLPDAAAKVIVPSLARQIGGTDC